MSSDAGVPIEVTMKSTDLDGDGRGNGSAVSLPGEVRSFRPHCPSCSVDVVLRSSSRPCSFYDCPGLPSQLEVTCKTCVFDFYIDEGTVRCDHDTCETARRLRANVPTYRAWLRLLEAERDASAEVRNGHDVRRHKA
jgi:hypothetical protein